VLSDVDDREMPVSSRVRAIRYQRKGCPPRTLLTSLVDAKQYPAAELRILYHERWEIALGFGELKTDMLQRLEAIRSRSPDAVKQELWGLLLAYNLVRLKMERMADETGVAPTRISFVAALRLIIGMSVRIRTRVASSGGCTIARQVSSRFILAIDAKIRTGVVDFT
jgi:Transposase DDE domain